ncbi:MULTISPECIES: DUF6114 domain-containing protein [unclassified Streptomyces]|uniref:DUF6114 domain-containing protein n=1 Tax=unclassified Streptomyces TaxID=2593676 RepID=UPI0023651E98|nr:MULTISPECIES: DUF6114 domain-containing protein [unclassified Streptomyces]MDF3144329.1 DUF6114 domain-containing protein [Streptomyces sp. T21Q-yed]WDF41345.1 DUF6114 domain-containing protein [Streptomyces sp. T12]
MSAETPAVSGQFTHRRTQFRAWRGTRPFWAGLFVMLGGLPIAYFPYANLQIGHLTLAMQTAGGSSSLIIGVLLVVLGFTLWFQKHVRTFAGVAAILLALVSIPLSNLGGFLIGFFFALIGGAMAVSWAPGAPPESEQAQRDTTGAGGAPEGLDPDTTVLKPVQDTAELGKSNDLSGTSPANGANGRHSAG